MEDEDKIIRGYEVISAWKNGQCGKTARAQKSGKNYFIKIYQNPVEPVMSVLLTIIKQSLKNLLQDAKELMKHSGLSPARVEILSYRAKSFFIIITM